MKENKLIAEFMGAKPIVLGNSTEYEMYGIVECINDGVDEKHFFIDDEMEYHTSWDWLMPVVEKINLLDDYRYTVLIASMDTQIVNNITNDVIVEVSCKHSVDELIKSVYDAVVEFIKEYNKIKN